MAASPVTLERIELNFGMTDYVRHVTRMQKLVAARKGSGWGMGEVVTSRNFSLFSFLKW